MKKYGEPIFGTVAEKAPVTKTTHGYVRGENRDGIAIFRGIPYGGACDGQRRFLPPIPAEHWDGILDCTQNGPYAVQEGCSISGSKELGAYFSGGRPELFGVAEERQSENCLVLNVLTPGLDEQKRPVVVYIHGGGFTSGSGTLVLGADKFVREEDIVVIGINHRLNVFGYLYLGELDARYAQSGMAGMLDIVLALQWIRDNAQAFGGDPTRVTIMGESGGGMKVNHLLAMEQARGLFHRAIVESSPLSVAQLSRKDAAAFTDRLLKALKIERSQWRKLLDIPAQELVAAVMKLETHPLSILPVADEISLSYDPGKSYTAPEISKDIPVMIGSSEDEVGVFVREDEIYVTADHLAEKLLEASPNWCLQNSSITVDNVEEIVRFVQSTNDKNDDAVHLLVKIKSLFGELGGDAYEQAKVMAEANTAPVYHYLVRYDSPCPGWPDRRFSWHTADLPLQFRIVLYPQSERLSRQMAHTWAAFIRTGDPSTDSLVWPRFTNEEKNMMVFDQTSEVRADPFEQMRKYHRRRI